MYADLEITAGMIRLWDVGVVEFGTPFDHSCGIAGDEGVAIVKGLKMDATFTRAHYEAIDACLKRYRFKARVYYRWKLIDGVWKRLERRKVL